MKPSLYFKAASDVQAAIKDATLAWAKVEDEEEKDGEETPGGDGDDEIHGGDGE